MRSYRIRLSPIPSDLRSRQVDPPAGNAEEAERLIEILVRDLAEPGALFPSSAHQPAAESSICVRPDPLIDVHDRPLIEVATPAAKQAADAGYRVLGFVGVPLARRPHVDSSKQALHRFLRRPGADIWAPILTEEATDRVAEKVNNSSGSRAIRVLAVFTSNPSRVISTDIRAASAAGRARVGAERGRGT